MRPKTSKRRWCLATATVSGAAVALAAGCGSAVPTAPLDSDDAADAGADVVKPPSTPDSGTPDSSPPAPTHAIGGSITGLQGTGLVLKNGSETLDIAASATSFAFSTKVASGMAFSVTVETQPNAPTQHCTVTGGTGTVVAGDVATVAINCTTTSFTVGGEVVGLAGGGLVLTTTGDGDAGANEVDLPINAVGTFALPAQLSGSAYAVKVKAPGTYDSAAGETFPIRPKSNQNIVGDIANKGAGVTPTLFTGGKYPAAFIDGSTAVPPYAAGINYSITAPGSGSGIQF